MREFAVYFVSEECEEPEETEDKREGHDPNEQSDEGPTRVLAPVQHWVDVAVA